ncbi:hypothetical protein GQ568_01980 [Patescibacteria group bacterium]|nr:hypothetical protein [Patescibacteria group bacterium]
MTEGFDVIFSFTYLIAGILPIFVFFALFAYSDNKRKEAEKQNEKLRIEIKKDNFCMKDLT